MSPERIDHLTHGQDAVSRIWRFTGQAGGTSGDSSAATQQAPTIRVVSHSQGNKLQDSRAATLAVEGFGCLIRRGERYFRGEAAVKGLGHVV